MTVYCGRCRNETEVGAFGHHDEPLSACCGNPVYFDEGVTQQVTMEDLDAMRAEERAEERRDGED